MYDIIYTQKFKDDISYYFKKKKYTHITDDMQDIISELENGNFVGTEIPDISSRIPTVDKTFKVRAVNTDTHQGKSNGYRVIYYAVTDKQEVYMLTVYYKKDDNRVPSNEEIVQIIKEYCL